MCKYKKMLRSSRITAALAYLDAHDVPHVQDGESLKVYHKGAIMFTFNPVASILEIKKRGKVEKRMMTLDGVVKAYQSIVYKREVTR